MHHQEDSTQYISEIMYIMYQNVTPLHHLWKTTISRVL